MRRESDGVKCSRSRLHGMWVVACGVLVHSAQFRSCTILAQSETLRWRGPAAQSATAIAFADTFCAVQITTSLRRVRLLNDLDFSCVAGCGSWHAGWAKVASSKHILAAFISGHCALSSRHRQGQLVEGTPNTRQSVIRFTTIYEEEHGHMTIVGPRNYTVHTHCTYHA